MSVIRRLMSGRSNEERGGLPRGIPIYGYPTASGQVVTPETAARSAAVTACQRVLTSTIASFPVDTVRIVGDSRQDVYPQPLIVRAPSGLVSRRAFVAQMVKSLTGAGNFYGSVVAVDGRGYPTQIESVHYSAVSWFPNADGILKPLVNGRETDIFPRGDLVHIAASQFIQPGSPVADSPVELAKQSIGTGLAAEEFGARFFGDGYHPTVVAKVDRDITPEQADHIKSRINHMRTSREPGVFGSGIELEAWPIKPDDSQFIDLMRFEIEQACRFFGVPPAMVYAAVSGQSVTYANVSQADLQYLKHSVGIWMLDIEDAWSSWLPNGQSVKFNVDGLLRMDAAGRHDLYGARLASKTIAINEVRSLEDESRFDDPAFDQPGIPGVTSDSPDPEEP